MVSLTPHTRPAVSTVFSVSSLRPEFGEGSASEPVGLTSLGALQQNVKLVHE